MTEAEWLTCESTWPMLSALGDRIGDRKLRLLVVACCRRVYTDEKYRAIRRRLALIERVAEGDRIGDQRPAQPSGEEIAPDRLEAMTHPNRPVNLADVQAILSAALGHVTQRGAKRKRADWGAALAAHVALLRCVVGNPFSPVAADPAWLSSTVVGLASAIYADRAFDRLPILADALEDADCGNADILNHCRSHSEHARGCWVVDLILGKC